MYIARQSPLVLGERSTYPTHNLPTYLPTLTMNTTTPSSSITIRTHKPSDIDWIISRHAALYATEYNFNDKFTTLVSQIARSFHQTHHPALERCWIAEHTASTGDPTPVGCIMLVKDSTEGPDTAKLRLLLVEPSARGMGVGRSLIRTCVEFARQAGYQRIVLWTQRVLDSARRLYAAEGFRLSREEEHEGFGTVLVGEIWEREL
ncbi:GNAT family N-acetyltransferase [Aspergillus clavatus NRRL 1]|uniref:GNAT family acetyltransferase, putative n=1 Tax=Aspergillus clavatus (strain ATCC 1007 / CBS 513.65 / DSM 816 / NCTC 3887 / NRRL 1 / QM 1276 / 107) TaxID=344612 RepID=A1CFK2_ASPCL|nr:GNAT family acetyltransferase, putative [Aspergillus clavatus NRRL 1]EAW11651.1 GNAT family acetyltransferase, putative [Aspergillus clavatus NRRL 1]